MTFSGTQNAINAALSGLTYAPTNGYAGADTLSIASNDGTRTANSSVAITVQGGNHSPVIGAAGLAGSVIETRLRVDLRNSSRTGDLKRATSPAGRTVAAAAA